MHYYAALVLIVITGLTTAALPDQAKKMFLSKHNKARDVAHVPHLAWSAALETYARNWGHKCLWKHSKGPYGENIYSSSHKTNELETLARSATDMWLAEKPRGIHYVNMVRKAYKHVGCAIVHCSNAHLNNFVICDYSG
ncbi:unnamed protein product [Lymnaea stagnalis]|uniref:SCP domain-containing protein n=1 Tax=Lymnaea stagnalis TaxID=6523 RepID=A0AAV2I323_LYMST